MVKDEAVLTLIFIVLLDFASSLYLSQSSVTMEPGKSLAISCRDKGGQPVTWKGPRGTLNANTKPKIQDTSIGKLLVFTVTRVQDTGNYTCSLMNNKNDYSIFSLIVEESDTEKDSSEIPDTDSESDINLETQHEPETLPPNHENRYPNSHRKTHKPHRTKHRHHETTTQEPDTEQDLSEIIPDTESELDKKIETQLQPETPPPIHENRHPNPYRKTHTPHRTKHRHHETTTQEPDTEQDPLEIPDTESDKNLETKFEPETPPPIHENRYPNPYGKSQKQPGTEQRHHETSTEESDTEQDPSEIPDTDSELDKNLETQPEPETPPPIHENHYPVPNGKTHKTHRTKHRHHETTTQDTDTTESSETSTIDHSNTHSHSGRIHNNDVTEEPIEFKDTPEIQRGKEGENATLRCEVNRPYKINWLLDDTKDNLGTKYLIIGDGLLIVNVSREDNRVFICEALKSTTGQVLDRKIRFVVEHKPVAVTIPKDPDTIGEPPVYAQDDEVYGFIGEQVNLTCEVEAEPPPQFEWKSFKLGRNKVGRIINVSSHKSILQLKMTKDTPDKYQCTATNKYGKLKKFINLQIGTRPSPPGKMELLKAAAHSLELKVEIPQNVERNISSDMEPKWLSIFYRIESAEDWNEQDFNITSDTFRLTELNSSTKYEILSATKNVAGLSPLSNFSYFETTAGSVQISKPTIFSLAMIYTLILLTSSLA